MGRIESQLPIENSISQLRSQLGITQQGLADEIGVTRATVVALEKGDYNPSLQLAFRLALFFQKSIDEIFVVKTNEKSAGKPAAQKGK